MLKAHDQPADLDLLGDAALVERYRGGCFRHRRRRRPRGRQLDARPFEGVDVLVFTTSLTARTSSTVRLRRRARMSPARAPRRDGVQPPAPLRRAEIGLSLAAVAASQGGDGPDLDRLSDAEWARRGPASEQGPTASTRGSATTPATSGTTQIGAPVSGRPGQARLALLTHSRIGAPLMTNTTTGATARPAAAHPTADPRRPRLRALGSPDACAAPSPSCSRPVSARGCARRRPRSSTRCATPDDRLRDRCGHRGDRLTSRSSMSYRRPPSRPGLRCADRRHRCQEVGQGSARHRGRARRPFVPTEASGSRRLPSSSRHGNCRSCRATCCRPARGAPSSRRGRAGLRRRHRPDGPRRICAMRAARSTSSRTRGRDRRRSAPCPDQRGALRFRAAAPAADHQPCGRRRRPIGLAGFVRFAREDGRVVAALTVEDDGRLLGITDRARAGLCRVDHAERRKSTRPTWIKAGVTMLDPSDCLRSTASVTLATGRDDRAQRDPRAARIVGRTRLADRVGSRAVDVGRSARIAVVGEVSRAPRSRTASRIGPFSHLRPGLWWAARWEVGNFAELKNARLGEGVQASTM